MVSCLSAILVFNIVSPEQKCHNLETAIYEFRTRTDCQKLLILTREVSQLIPDT
jgi:hypothetical protein